VGETEINGGACWVKTIQGSEKVKKIITLMRFVEYMDRNNTSSHPVSVVRFSWNTDRG
jgi:hypothetical protein